jgi:hypothetical protein
MNFVLPQTIYFSLPSLGEGLKCLYYLCYLRADGKQQHKAEETDQNGHTKSTLDLNLNKDN